MPNGTSERSALIEHCGVGGSVRKGTLYPMVTKTGLKAALRSQAPEDGSSSKRSRASFMGQNFGPHMEQKCASRAPEPESVSS